MCGFALMGLNLSLPIHSKNTWTINCDLTVYIKLIIETIWSTPQTPNIQKWSLTFDTRQNVNFFTLIRINKLDFLK